jgi:hypothetical protein
MVPKSGSVTLLPINAHLTWNGRAPAPFQDAAGIILTTVSAAQGPLRRGEELE